MIVVMNKKQEIRMHGLAGWTVEHQYAEKEHQDFQYFYKRGYHQAFIDAGTLVNALEQIIKQVVDTPEKVSREEAVDMACEFKMVAQKALVQYRLEKDINANNKSNFEFE